MNTKSLTQQIKEARHEAFREAKGSYPWVWSRGTVVATANARGEQCSPSPAADARASFTTIKEAKRLAAQWEVEYPDVAKVYIEGGYDGGDHVEDKENDNYEPMVAMWSVTIWQRPEEPGQIESPDTLREGSPWLDEQV